MDIATIRVVLPQPQVVRISVLPNLTLIGGAAWGSITGTLSSQTDLQAALDAKLDKPDPLPARPTTLNEVIARGVAMGLWS